MAEQTMAERVARALAGADPGWAHFEQARRAIEAMREPTAAMLEAGDAVLCHEGAANFVPLGAAGEGYVAMIDAAMKEGGE